MPTIIHGRRFTLPGGPRQWQGSAILPGQGGIIAPTRQVGALRATLSATSSLSAATQNQSTGWTTFTASPDTNIVYVSSSTGVDAAGRGTIAAPLATPAFAGNINNNVGTLNRPITDGKPDWMLFKQGDSWTGAAAMFANSGNIRNNGRSATEPAVYGSYDPGQPGVVNPIAGKARPKFNFDGTVSGWDLCLMETFGGNGGDFLAITGLEFYAYKRDPVNNPGQYSSANAGVIAGAFGFLKSAWMLIEDCKWSYGQGNSFQGTGTLIMRRNVCTDHWQIDSGLGHSVGMFVANAATIVTFQNTWDNNGWNSTVPGSQTVFSRNLYIEQTCGIDVTATQEINCNSAAEGAQYRTGGIITNGLYISNSNGMDLGHHPDSPAVPTVHVANVNNNVIMLSRDIGGSPRGSGIIISQCISSGAGIHVNNNIIANLGPNGSDGSDGIGLDSSGVGCAGCDVTGNIVYNWAANSVFGPNLGINDPVGGNTIAPNVIDMFGTNAGGPPEPFPAPSRTVATYDAAILGGPGTLAHFLSLCRAQSKSTGWNDLLTADAVNTYIRAGFGR